MDEYTYIVLLDTGFDWPEVVYVGTFTDCDTYVQNVLGPILEAEGDEAIYYEKTALVQAHEALQYRRVTFKDAS